MHCECASIMAQAGFALLAILLAHAYSADIPTSDAEVDGIMEYCYSDIFFEPQCEINQAIILKTAQYGRMRKGRCVTDDFGYIGCSADILTAMDSKCSGQRSCQVPLGWIDTNIISTCPNGLRMYLEASYECVDVAYPPRGYCDSNSPSVVGGRHGFLSSLVTRETGCGSTNSPWRIQSSPGQQFQIRLWSFHYVEASDTIPDVADECESYALIDEYRSGPSKTICAGIARESPNYTSAKNVVDIQLMSSTPRDGDDSTGYFLVQYEAFGCADREAPTNGWLTRKGDELILGCNETSEHVHQWELQCNGTHWIGTDYNCSVAHITTSPAPEKTTKQSTTPKTMWVGPENTLSIIVIAGLAVVVCLCVALSCMAVYIVRYRRREGSHADDAGGSECQTHNRRIPSVNQHSPIKDGEVGSATETDNYWTWQKYQHAPRGNNFTGTNRSSKGTMISAASRQPGVPEESTILVRKVNDGRGRHNNGGKIPDYDKLVPDFMEVDSIRDVDIDISA